MGVAAVSMHGWYDMFLLGQLTLSGLGWFGLGVKRIHRNPDRSGSAEDPFESSKIHGSVDQKKKKKKKNRQLWRACAVRAQLRA